MKITLTLPGLPSCNSAAAPHWRTRHAERKEWYGKVAAATLLELGRWPKPLDRARVTLTRCSTTEPDADNLAGSFKHVLDGLIRVGIIVDDSPQHIDASFHWEAAKRGAGCVRVEVEPWPGATPQSKADGTILPENDDPR